VNTRREQVAGWLGGIAGAGGAGIAMLVCCTTTVLHHDRGGGRRRPGAAGGLLRSPWLIAACVAVLTVAGAALVVQRTGHDGADHHACYPPSTPTAVDPAVITQTRRR
jgi:hypothetical protein